MPITQGDKTKTEIEMQDFSWQIIRSFVIVGGIIALAVYIFRKKK